MDTIRPFTITQLLFLLLALLCLGTIYLGLQRVLSASAELRGRKEKILRTYLLGTVSWLAVVAALSLSGFLQDFSGMPPRMFLVLFVPLVSILLLTFSGAVKEILKATPPAWLVYIQSFRIVVEVLLWLLFLEGLLPEQMTFEGRNWDVLSGLLALPAAWLMEKFPRYHRTTGILFNLIGLGLLLNILSIAILSMPLPFRVFMNEPANTIVTYFPVVMLPAVLVPVAYGMHFFSLRQLLMQQDIQQMSENIPPLEEDRSVLQ